MNSKLTGEGADMVPKKNINEKFCQKKQTLMSKKTIAIFAINSDF